MAVDVEDTRAASHRPSRRGEIVSAAIRVFARYGFADTSIQAVAREAGVAPAAVYYHFSGKEDLSDAALHTIIDAINAVVREVRPDDAPADPSALAEVISAVWSWLDANPDACQLLYHHLPGTTARAAVLERGFEEVHVQRAFDYMNASRSSNSSRAGIGRQAAKTLAARTFIQLTILIHPMRGQHGPLQVLGALDSGGAHGRVAADRLRWLSVRRAVSSSARRRGCCGPHAARQASRGRSPMMLRWISSLPTTASRWIPPDRPCRDRRPPPSWLGSVAGTSRC